MKIAVSSARKASRGIVSLLLALLALSAPELSAQTELNWKLKDGDSFGLHVQQQTVSAVTVINKTTKATVEMALDCTWKVERVENGTARIRQTIDQVQLKVQAADAPQVVYDTAAPGQPSGAARNLADALAPLVDPESSIMLAMNARGEVSSVELSPKLAAAFDRSLTASQSLGALLRQPLVVLPENAVAVGDTWKSTRELTTPDGKFAQSVEYKLNERIEAGDMQAEITFSATLTPVTVSKAKITEQSQTGRIRFDSRTGRYLSGEQSQKLVTETPSRDATITVVVESAVKRTLVPK